MKSSRWVDSERLAQFWRKGFHDSPEHKLVAFWLAVRPNFASPKLTKTAADAAFADYVWKPVALIEMKKRGSDLQKHYRRAFDYWRLLLPNCPRHFVNFIFDGFRVCDFDTDLDAPKHARR
jgi:hypothetical protein